MTSRRITLFSESRFALDGGAMFGIIPRPLWARTNPPDDKNRISMAARCALIEDPQFTALIDVGMGSRWTDKETGIYRIEDQDPGLRGALAERSVLPEEIDEVILTHLHFDHAGGLQVVDEDDPSGLRPAFPQARHWLQHRNWGWANAPSLRDGGSYRQEDFAFFEYSGAPEIQLLHGVTEILPGVEVIPCDGHTYGMQIVKVTCDDATYLFLADLVPTSSHLRAPYVMGYDLQPLVTVAEKQAILYEAARHDWVLIFEHDPDVPAGRVELDRRGEPRLVPLDKPPASLQIR